MTSTSHNPVLSVFMIYHRVYSQTCTTNITSGSRAAYPSGPPEDIPSF